MTQKMIKEKDMLADLATFYPENVVQEIKDQILDLADANLDGVMDMVFENIGEDYINNMIPYVQELLTKEGYEGHTVENLLDSLPEEEIVNAIWLRVLGSLVEVYKDIPYLSKRLVVYSDYEWLQLELDGKPLGYVDSSGTTPGHERVPELMRVYMDMLNVQRGFAYRLYKDNNREMADIRLDTQDEVIPFLMKICGVEEDEISYR